MGDEQDRELAVAVSKRFVGKSLESIPVVGSFVEALTIGLADEAEKIAEKQRLYTLLESHRDQLLLHLEDHGEMLREIRGFVRRQDGINPQVRQQNELLAQQRIAPSKLYRHHAEDLIGRDRELVELQAAWDDGTARVFSIIAWGGAGKTALAAGFRARFAPETRDDCDGYLDWSFYQQGANSRDASSDAFFTHALEHLGLEVPDGSTAQIKARAVADRLMLGRWLLILDGLEPLQHPPGSATPGALRDEGLRELLQALGERDFPGLCLLTSRENLAQSGVSDVCHWPVLELEKLSDEAGARLLHRAGADHLGAAEIVPDHQQLKDASDELHGHPLSLQILGGYLKLAHDGDIRQRGAVPLTDAADEIEFTKRNVSKLLEDYVAQLAQSVRGRRMLAVLRLLGLFDRPAQNHCLDKLRESPVIPGLNDGLFADGEAVQPISSVRWKLTLKELGELRLIEPTPEGDAIDCHPLIREYFAAQLKLHKQAWEGGHLRLFEHLCEHTKPHQPEGEAGLRPLFQAVRHGCLAGRHLEALGTTSDADSGVYIARIHRGNKAYSVRKLGLFTTELAVLGGFFGAGETGSEWQRPNQKLCAVDRAWLLNIVAFHLRALGRLNEARQPIAAAIEVLTGQENWKNAAPAASNLSELSLALGDISTALAEGVDSVHYADLSGVAFQRMNTRSSYADALHQSGQRQAARDLFERAEAIHMERQHRYPRLYSLPGFRYADLLLSAAERLAWHSSRVGLAGNDAAGDCAAGCVDCAVVEQRVIQTLQWMQADPDAPLLTVAMDQITLARSGLYRVLLSTDNNTEISVALAETEDRIATAVDGLRKANSIDHVPRGLLTRAWLYHLQGRLEPSRADLREARQIAEAGPMPLHLADIALTEARLFHDHDKLAEARTLINKHGYHRRDEELADAERMLAEL